MSFSPPNYATSPDGSRTLDESGRVDCYCGRKVWPFALIDVRHLDNVEHNWSCEACWTGWQRNRHPIMKAHKNNAKLQSQDNVVSRKEWDGLWVKAHGATQDVIDKILNSNRRA